AKGLIYLRLRQTWVVVSGLTTPVSNLQLTCMQASLSAKAVPRTGRRIMESALAAPAAALGVPSRMYHSRAARQLSGAGGSVPPARDPRVFPFGVLLRRL